MKLKNWTGTLHAGAGLVEHFMAALELVLMAVVGRVATWIAPLPSAILVGRAAGEIFDLGGWWPWIMAGTIELVGLATSNLWLTAREWNENKRQSDPDANEGLAFGLMVAYFVIAFLLLLSLEVPKVLQTGDPAGLTALLFPCLSIVSLLALNERAAQSKRQADLDREIAQREARKAERKAAEEGAEADRKRQELNRQRAELDRQREALDRQRAEMKRQQAAMEAEARRKQAEADRKALDATLATLGTEAETLRQYAGNPAATQAEVAEALGASERTIRNHLSRLEDLGLVKRNGQGVRVLVDLP